MDMFCMAWLKVARIAYNQKTVTSKYGVTQKQKGEWGNDPLLQKWGRNIWNPYGPLLHAAYIRKAQCYTTCLQSNIPITWYDYLVVHNLTLIKLFPIYNSTKLYTMYKTGFNVYFPYLNLTEKIRKRTANRLLISSVKIIPVATMQILHRRPCLSPKRIRSTLSYTRLQCGPNWGTRRSWRVWKTSFWVAFDAHASSPTSLDISPWVKLYIRISISLQA